MMAARISSVGGQFEALFGAGTATGLSDEELLGRFIGRRDAAAEAAFEALVHRHGPMVLATCRRLLREPDGAADAFQATFLVLARRAGSVRDPAALGAWLHRVARHAAMRARLRSVRRKARERLVAVTEVDATAPADEPTGHRELRDLLGEELDRLPRSFREPVVLCYLEGLTHDEAAAHLNCPVGTVRSRLARARDRLRGRLARRGLAPTAIATMVLAAPGPAPAAVPTPLVGLTVRAASRLASGDPAAARALSGPAFSLMEGVIRTMFRNALGKIAAAAVFTGVVLVPLASVAHLAMRPGRGQDRADRIVATAPDRPGTEVAEARGDWDDLAGRWEVIAVEDSGRKVEPVEAGFNECRALAPKPEAKSGTESAGWLILYLDGRMYTEWHVTKLDHAAEPGALDFDTARDMAAGAKGEIARSPIYHKAIYRLKGDELTVCLGRGVRTGQPARPRDFAAEDGSGQMLIKFRRRPAPAK